VLAEAKETGLKTLFIEEKARDYIQRQQQPEMTGESSVKTGITKDFVNSNKTLTRTSGDLNSRAVIYPRAML
jgi:hypothetical protein